MSNSCYIIQEREFIKTGEEIYKIGKTKQEGTKRINQYPKGSEIILLMKVENCDEFENKVKILFNKKYNQRKDIGIEYYKGNKDEMVKDYFNLKNEKLNIFIDDLKKNKKEHILDENQTYYYPINQLEKFNDILKNSIKFFNEKNNTDIKYESSKIGRLMEIYNYIILWNMKINNNIKEELVKIKNDIEEEILENTCLQLITELIIDVKNDMKKLNVDEKKNMILNTLSWLENNKFNCSYKNMEIIKKKYENNEITVDINKKITNNVSLKLYNSIINNKIIDEIIEIKNELKKTECENNYEYNEKICNKKRIIYSLYYKNNISFKKFDLKMLKNIENRIKKSIPYELLKDDNNNYIGIKYVSNMNMGRIITNISYLQDIIEEDLEGWITNNIKEIYEKKYQYMVGLNLTFNPIFVINAIQIILNDKEKDEELIIKIYNDIQNYIAEIIKNSAVDLNKYFLDCDCFDEDMNNSYSDSDSDSDSDTNHVINCYNPMKNLNDIEKNINDYLIKYNENKITKNIKIEEKFYNKLDEKNEKILNKFLKNAQIQNYNEHPILIDIGKNSKIIIYDSNDNKIIDNNFYYMSLNTLQKIRHKNKINNIQEYDNFLKCIMNESSIKEFKYFSKSVLINKYNLKCQIIDNKCNIIFILTWLLYFLNYSKIDIDLNDEKICDYKKELNLKKKIIILRCKSEIDIKKANDIMSKYNNNNFIIINKTKKIIENINIINNFNIINKNGLKKYFNDEENITNDDVYKLLDNELVILFDWINGKNNLNEYIKINNDNVN